MQSRHKIDITIHMAGCKPVALSWGRLQRFYRTWLLSQVQHFFTFWLVSQCNSRQFLFLNFLVAVGREGFAVPAHHCWVWNANYWGQPVSTSCDCQAIIIKLYKPSYWFPFPVIVIVSVKYWLLGAVRFHQLWLSGHYNKAVQTIILIPFGLFFIEPMHMCDRRCYSQMDVNFSMYSGQ